ncbi:MAG: efflux RND transporter periplasmic adaptor subunit [Planctomycetaceae bacterium]|nr:efflux RND transporter periplasmic adaptor subunit [Planctomycetaceae bacterium]
MSHESPAGPKSILQTILSGLPTVLILATMGGGWMVMHHVMSSHEPSDETAEAETETDETLADTVKLPEGKIEAGQFESMATEPQFVQHTHTVPGRIRYDQTKHIDVKAPMDGIITELLVEPGDRVTPGQLLAVIRSPEIGKARAEVLRVQQQREIVTRVYQREVSLAENLKQLLVMLNKRSTPDEIETAFRDRALGSYRVKILSSYTNMLLAADLAAQVRPLVASGSVPERTLKERENERQLAETEFRSACDEATFAAEQDKMLAAANLAEEERQLKLAWQSVETLLGYKEQKEMTEFNNDEEALSRLEVRAPFAGSIESRAYADNERVMRGESILVLADTRSLAVEASIREGDWLAVSLEQGAPVHVVVPALQNRTFPATIRYFGREVQADTNAVPLVAMIDNSEGLLRPGMYVRVSVPIGEPRQVLSVKPESILQHENSDFVFLDLNGGTFQRVDIKTGETSDEWVEVTDGLSQGQLVVTNGAFLLKSELLLQGEGE